MKMRAKQLGLLAVLFVSWMTIAGPAAATTVTAPSGTAYTGSFALLNEGNMTIDGFANVYCSSSVLGGSIESHGSSVTAKAALGFLGFAGCFADSVNVLKNGSLEFHATSGGNSTVTSSGAEVTTEVPLGVFGTVHCIFATNNTDLGVLTAAANNESHATLNVDSSAIPIKAGSFLCGSSVELTGSYKVTTPTGFRVD
jgi:hypothetical protein